MENKIVIKIDVTKIDKSRLYEGKSGIYLDAIMLHNKGESKYGDDGFIVQSTTAEERAAGVKGGIIGNWRYLAPVEPKQETSHDDKSQVPF